MKNEYLIRQRAIQNELINQGRNHGEQWTLDLIEVVLHQQFGWGYDRIKRLIDAVSEADAYYHPAVESYNPEQPIYQERLDNVLRDIVGERQEFYPFKERYQLITEARYDKPLKQKGR